MTRAKKESHPIAIRMDKGLFDRLEDYCQRSGQPKTVAIERAVKAYIDEYNRKEERYAKTEVSTE